MRPSGTIRSFVRTVLSITRKDLVAEFRSHEMIGSMLVFSLLVILIFNFTIELEPSLRLVITPGVLWVTFLFAGTLALNRSITSEKERGCFDGLLLAPVDRSAVFLGKMIGILLSMIVVELILLPIYSLLYNINLLRSGLLLIIFLGSFGYATVGTLLSNMAVQTRLRDMLLPIMLFPVILPLLLASVRASGEILQGVALSGVSTWLNLLVVYDIVFLAISIMVFDYLVED